MIRSSGDETSSTYSQTLNRHEIKIDLFNFYSIILEWQTLSGPFLVSRTGDVG
jgi:hypothetical protein